MINLKKLYEELKNSKYTIFCDMDGVLVDFEDGYKTLTGETTTEANAGGTSYFWDLYRKSLDEKQISERDFWTNLKPLPDKQKLWDFISPYNPNILSAPAIDLSQSLKDRYDPEKNECIMGKKMWIAKNLSPSPNEENFVASSQKSIFSGENQILIDDREDIIRSWNDKGGIGILHTSAANTIKKLEIIFNER